MINNEDLQKDVQNAIKWEPLLHAAEIGVTAKDGVVTLTGSVDSYAKKFEAESAAKRVTGVLAVVEKIEINMGIRGDANDNDIAIAVLNALKWSWQLPKDKIKVKVEDHWVTLEGELEWNYQKVAAKNLIKNLLGVIGVTNNIQLTAEIHDKIEKEGIQKALARNWSIGKRNINVLVSGTKVTLTGRVKSWYERDEAERIAWNAPGIKSLDNELIVNYEASYAN